MIKDKFFAMFDQTRFMFIIKIIFLFFVFVVIINLVDIAYSKYEAKANMVAKANIAYFVASEGEQTQTIAFEGMVPSNEKYEYSFQICNYDEAGNKSNVDLKYVLNFRTTTNLPLEIEIYRLPKDGGELIPIVEDTNITTDEDVYFKNFYTSEQLELKQSNIESYTYKVFVKFPENYKSMSDLYQGTLDLFEIKISAEQVV